VSKLVERSGDIALVITIGVWVAVLVSMLRHPIYVSHDSLISYAHAWYVSEQVWHAHRFPLHMPVVSHGGGFAFPYGIVPWTAAALLHPLFGDWATTLVLVTATVGVIAGTFWAFPELRRGWWAVAVLVGPALVTSPLIGQIPFLTGAALLFLAIGAWRRNRQLLALVAAGLAQATHPAVLLPLTALLVVGWLYWEPRRAALIRTYCISVCVAIPAAIIVFASPVFGETALRTKAWALLTTIAPRSLIFLVPLTLVVLRRYTRPEVALVAVAILLGGNAAMWAPLGMPWAYHALVRTPDTRMAAFARGTDFSPGATYRVLRVADGKVGQYQLLRAGAKLDSEFFPESIDRRSWPSTSQYGQFLSDRRVDFVMLWGGYDHVFHTNEHSLLRQMSGAGCTGSVSVTLVRETHDYDLYSVAHQCPAR
jgi:hypothetical protein